MVQETHWTMSALQSLHKLDKLLVEQRILKLHPCCQRALVACSATKLSLLLRCSSGFNFGSCAVRMHWCLSTDKPWGSFLQNTSSFQTLKAASTRLRAKAGAGEKLSAKTVTCHAKLNSLQPRSCKDMTGNVNINLSSFCLLKSLQN